MTSTIQIQGKTSWTLRTALLGMLLLAACAKNPNLNPNPQPTPTPNENEQEAPPTAFKPEPLAWESSSKPERKNWSTYAMQVVAQEYDRFNQVQDAQFFCPSYSRLNRNQRINFWGQLIAAISYYESAWSPVSRMQETTMGYDPVTGRPVYSEGLLQLSYQDIQWATYCQFDWSKDKYLSSTDPKKTILDPYKNLYCGIRILGDQIARKKEIMLNSGVYWAVIRENGKYEKIDEIAAITKRLTFCR